MPKRERLPRPHASALQPRSMRAVRRRVVMPCQRAVLRERQVRRLSRRFQLPEHCAALQERRLRVVSQLRGRRSARSARGPAIAFALLFLVLGPAVGAAPLDDERSVSARSSRKTPPEFRADQRVVRVRFWGLNAADDTNLELTRRHRQLRIPRFYGPSNGCRELLRLREDLAAF